MITLHGRTALVTGGSRGIGRAVVAMLARAGADVAIGYHTRAAEAESVAAGARAAGRRAIAVGGDLGDPAAVDAIAGAVAEAFGRLDIFVANAGIWPPDEVPLGRLSPDRWRGTMTANLDAVFHSTRAALGLMGPGGRVVLVASTAGQRGEAGHADYAAAKGAVIALTKSLAIEYAPDILVNCVAPGWVDTDMAAPAFGGGEKERIARTIPLRRIPTAEQIAGPIVFLCSDLASHVTGEVLNVNGGSVLCG
ncbi:MAG TPA: SDR family oxidoreductase [Gemmatimonadales bacterium]|nr:SDR family oxidoreductase [Gemmatimonadales bacterium]